MYFSPDAVMEWELLWHYMRMPHCAVTIVMIDVICVVKYDLTLLITSCKLLYEQKYWR